MASIICPSCKSPAPAGAIFCDNCGYDLRAITAVSNEPIRPIAPQANAPSGEIVCPNCNYTNIVGSVFCENCGTQLPKQVVGIKPAPVSPMPTPPAKAPEIPPPDYVPPPESPPPAMPQMPIPDSTSDTMVGKQSSPKKSPDTIPGRLVIPSKNVSISLPPGNKTIVIGREDPVSGVFPDVDLDPHGGHEAGVGRRHAQLLLQDGDVFIEDLDSVNGSAVNKQKLQPRNPRKIVSGDELRFGKLILVYMDK